MDDILKASAQEIGEADLDAKIAQVAAYARRHPDHCLYVRLGGRHRKDIQAIAATYEAEIRLLRRFGPPHLNWIAVFIPGHEALLKLHRSGSLPDLYEAALKDEFVNDIFVVPTEHESAFLSIYAAKISPEFDPSVLGNSGLLLRFVFTDSEAAENVVCWSYAGTSVDIDFSARKSPSTNQPATR